MLRQRNDEATLFCLPTRYFLRMTEWLGGRWLVRLKFFNGKSTRYGVSFDSGMFENLSPTPKPTRLRYARSKSCHSWHVDPKKSRFRVSKCAGQNLYWHPSPDPVRRGRYLQTHNKQNSWWPNVETKTYRFSVAEYPEHARNHAAVL